MTEAVCRSPIQGDMGHKKIKFIQFNSFNSFNTDQFNFIRILQKNTTQYCNTVLYCNNTVLYMTQGNVRTYLVCHFTRNSLDEIDKTFVSWLTSRN